MTSIDLQSAPIVEKSTVPADRPIRLKQLIWLTWRQHRAIVLTTAALALAVGTTLLVMTALVKNCGVSDCSNQWLNRGAYELIIEQLLNAVFYFPAFVAALWGAPLITREYEQRTQVVAWGYDLSPRRWLLSKALLLAVTASIIGVALWLMSRPAIHYLIQPESFRSLSPFDTSPFGINPLTLIPHTIFGLAAGIALGAILRRTIPALTLGLVAIVAIQLTADREARPHWYLPPVSVISPMDSNVANNRFDENGHYKGIYIGEKKICDSGRVINLEKACHQNDDPKLPETKPRALKVFYQSPHRLEIFRFIEAGYLVIMTAGALTIALYCIRRRRIS